MNENLDGVRAYWDGKILLSKYSVKISCPGWFVDLFPQETALDGVLWMGRGKFDEMQELVKSTNKTNNMLWKGVKYIVFDLPHSNKPFESRINDLRRIKFHSEHLQITEYSKCNGNREMLELLDKIVSTGGNGLIMTKYNSLYLPGRRSTLLKIKV